MKIDLHCHSNISDGTLSPTELVELAHANGAHMLALTDHDHIGGLPEARMAAQKVGLQFINGVEISITWRSRTIHIVGLNFDDGDHILNQLLFNNRSGRIERMKKMAEKLAKKGKIEGAYEGAMAYADNPEMVSRTHLARFLLDKGYIRTKEEAFKKWLGDGKPASVKHEWVSLQAAVDAIIGAGGVAVIAHPARYGLTATALRALTEEFVECGGRGIEVACSSHSLSDRLNCALLAGKYNLYASVGSDFHTPNHFGHVLGQPPELPPLCKPIWHLFEEG